MGIIVLVIAAVVEIAFGAYCIATKSNQNRIRSWIRISALGLFAVLVVVSVIEWSFKWYLLAALLFLWTVISGISLMRNKKRKREYRAVRVVLTAIIMWLLTAITVVPVLIFPDFVLPEITGEHQIETVVFTYTDKSRLETFRNTGENRKVTAEFYYPIDSESRHPLVLFSHGAFGVRPSNTSTYRNLASNGYVVCSISHPYHSMYDMDTDGKFTLADRSFIQEVLYVNKGIYDNKTAYQLGQKWLKVRTDDMNFVLDTIITISKSEDVDKVYHLVDTMRIGVMGHSLGGAASARLGRDRSDIDAVINLDGDLLGEELGFVDGEYVINREIYPVPMLSMYTDTMKSLLDSAAASGIVLPQKLISATAPNAYEVHIAGTNHMSVTDLPLVSPFLVTMLSGSVEKGGGEFEADKHYVVRTMNRLVLEFFDSYLKGEGSFQTAESY